MAYATNLAVVTALKESGYPDRWQTSSHWTAQESQSFKSPEARSVALRHLTNAIALYEQAGLAQRATNASAQGDSSNATRLAWCLDQSGQQAAALVAYRKALKTAWKMEVTGDFVFKEWVKDVWDDVKAGRNPIHGRNRGFVMVGECYCEEIIGYMLKLLDPGKDAKEIAELTERQKTPKSTGRAITPILVPLERTLGSMNSLTRQRR
jgi:hypothetical protein